VSGRASAGGGTMTLVTVGAEQTRRLGEALGRVAEPGDVFLLQGPFGAGKTVFVQGLARGLDVETPVTSPSFVLASEHRGRVPLVHVDLFRVEAPEAALRAALYDYLEGDGVCAVEWPERLALPEGLVVTRVEIAGGDDTRRIRVTPAAARQAHALAAFADAAGEPAVGR